MDQRQTFFTPSSETPRGPSTSLRMKAYLENASKLALQASLKAVNESKIEASEITHLVTVSCSGFGAPGVDFDLIEGLNLVSNIKRTSVGFMGCHGAINGMRTATDIVLSDAQSVVLLCATEICSLHQPYTDDPQQLVASSLFADGAAAIVLCGSERHSKLVSQNGPTEIRWKVRDFASCWLPNTRDLMSWHIGDYGFEMSLSPKVPETIESHLQEWVVGWLATLQLTVADVGRWVVHPGGPKVLDSVEASLKLDSSKLGRSRSVLQEHGNMSSPTVLMILQQGGAPVRDELAVLLAFGPGLCIEAAVLQGS